MKNIRKNLMIGMTALTLGAGALTVHAAAPDAGARDGMMSPEAHAKSEARMKERFDQHQKELHDKLKLSAGQEGAWSKFIDRMKPGTPSARPDRAKMASMTAPERMDAMVARMKEVEARMTDRAAAVKEFYAVLTPEQQKTFNDQFAQMHRHGGQKR